MLDEQEIANVPTASDIQDKGWMYFAECKGLTYMMFPKSHKDISYIPEARALCAACPVSTQCLDYALEFPVADMHGIWSGMTSRQLQTEQKRRGVGPIRPTLSQMWSD